MRVPPTSYRLYKNLYYFAYSRLRTWPGKVSIFCLSLGSCAWVMNRLMESEETRLEKDMKQLEEIERMLEKAKSLRAAAVVHRVGLDAAEKEELRLREKVGEWEMVHGGSKK